MKEVVLSTGVGLTVKPVSKFLLQRLLTDMDKARPKMPLVYIKEDDRKEENPNDPAYIEALREWQADRGLKIHDAMIALGTEPVAPLPIEGCDDPNWQEAVRFTGVQFDDTKLGRYVAWVKYVAGPSDEDTALLIAAVQSAAGVPEAEVAKATDLFRSGVSGSPDTGGPSQA